MIELLFSKMNLMAINQIQANGLQPTTKLMETKNNKYISLSMFMFKMEIWLQKLFKNKHTILLTTEPTNMPLHGLILAKNSISLMERLKPKSYFQKLAKMILFGLLFGQKERVQSGLQVNFNKLINHLNKFLNLGGEIDVMEMSTGWYDDKLPHLWGTYHWGQKDDVCSGCGTIYPNFNLDLNKYITFTAVWSET